MARIVGRIGTSHVPTIAMAYDKKSSESLLGHRCFENYRPVSVWLATTKPD